MKGQKKTILSRPLKKKAGASVSADKPPIAIDLNTPRLNTDELLALLQVSDAMAASENRDQVLHHIVRHAARLTGADHASIALVTGDNLEFLAQVGLPGSWLHDVPMKSGITGWVAHYNRSQNISNVLEDKRYIRPNRNSNFRSELAVPIRAEGTVLGVVDVQAAWKNAFTSRHQYLLEELAKRAAFAIHNARRLESVTQQLLTEIRHLELLQDIDLKLTERLLDVDGILETVLECAMAETSADIGQFWVPEGSVLVVKREIGITPSTVGRGLPVVGPGIAAQAYLRREPIIADDVHSLDWAPIYVEFTKGMQSEVAMPIFAGDQCLGLLDLESSQKAAFKKFHLEFLSRLAQRVSITIGIANKINALHRVSRAAAGSQSTSLGSVLDTIYSGVHELFPETDSAILLRSDTDPDVLRYYPGNSYKPRKHWKDVRSIRMGASVVGRAAKTGETVLEQDVSRKSSPTDHVVLIPNGRTSVGFPLINPQNRVIGGFSIESPIPYAFTSLDLRVLEIFAGFASTALSNYLFISELDDAWRALDLASQQKVANASLTVLGEITGNLIHHIGNDIGVAHEEIKDLLNLHRRASLTRNGLLIAKRNTGTVLGFVKHLLDRLSDTTQLVIEDLSLKDAVNEAVRDYGQLPANVQLIIDLERLTPLVRSTRALPLVIAEIIRNATAAIGKNKGKIRVSSSSKGDIVSMFIWNSGAPIPVERRSFIFDFLYHRRSGGKRGGMGFGLWWARSVLRAQGGDIVLSEDLNRSGTMFELILRRGAHHEVE